MTSNHNKNNKMNQRSKPAHRKYNLSFLLMLVLIESQLSSPGLAASFARPEQTGSDSNSIQQTTNQSIAKTQTQESGARQPDGHGTEVGPMKQRQPTNNKKEHASPTTTNGHYQATSHNKKPLSLKAETLLKGLSNFMNPSLNAANYFVPSTSSFHGVSSNLVKSDGLQKTSNNNDADPDDSTSLAMKTISHSLKETEQQMASSQATENSAQQSQPLSEPSTLVNMQASADGMVNAPTRMSRPGNYIFRWGR